MSTWIAWPPESLEDKFPSKYFQGDPLNEFQDGIEEEKCKACGFTVRFISDIYQFENWNGHTHEFVAEILLNQRRIGKCPDHPKPNWMV